MYIYTYIYIYIYIYKHTHTRDFGAVSESICVFWKVKNYAGYYRLNTTILSDTYKYLNYMFHPLWPSSVWLQHQKQKLHDIIWHRTNICVA